MTRAELDAMCASWWTVPAAPVFRAPAPQTAAAIERVRLAMERKRTPGSQRWTAKVG